MIKDLFQQLNLQSKHFVGGEFVSADTDHGFMTFDPARNEALASFSIADNDLCNQACSIAREQFDRGTWSLLPVQERARRLHKLADLLDQNREALARLESYDTGKPISETLNGDIPRAAANLRFFADLACHQKSDVYLGEEGHSHTSLREPLGVCLLITPWNLPLYLETWKLAPALMQGNSVILKPAEQTPLTACVLADLSQKAEIPAGVFQVLHGLGPDSTGEFLTTHQEIDAISFTGETSTGRAIMANAAPTLKKVSFELGGKGASVVFDDANWQRHLPTIVRAAFRNQGQICLAGSRLIVHNELRDQLIDAAATEISKIRIGDPQDKQTLMGALISNEHRKRVDSFVQLARERADHEVLVGGHIPTLPNEFKDGAFYEPTLIRVDGNGSELIQSEIFGPVLTVQSFDDVDEAIELVNGTDYGLSASIYTESRTTADYTTRKIRSGLIWVNTWFSRNLHTAFGGMKASGLGREGGQYSLDFFSEYKTVTESFD